MLPPGLSSVRAPNLIRAGLIRSRRLHTTQAPLASGYTLHTCWALEGDFDLVRLIYANDSTSAAYTVDQATVCAVAQDNAAAGYVPVDAAGNVLAFAPVTFNNGGADTLPYAQATGATASLTVPVSPQAGVPTLNASDWIALPSTPPLVAGQMRYLAVRSYFSAAARAQSGSPISNAPTFNAGLAAGRTVVGIASAGSKATQTTSISTTVSNYVTPNGVQYFCRARGATVLCLGDSITAGTGSTTGLSPWGHLACAAASTAGRPVSFVNSGVPSQTSNLFYSRAFNEIDLFRPDVVAIAAYTPNDTQTVAAMDTAFARAMEIAHYAISQGSVPVLWTPIPYSGLGATTDGYRKAIVARLRALAATGSILLFDADAALSDGATPARILPAYDSGDGIHPSDAGHAAMAAAFATVLRRVLP